MRITSLKIFACYGLFILILSFGQKQAFAASPTPTPTPTADQSLINVVDYGVIGNGSTCDDTAFQSAIDAAPNGAKIIVPSNLHIKICNQLKIWGRAGLTITGNLESSYNAPNNPSII